MKVCFFDGKAKLEGLLAEAFDEGLRVHGDEGIIRRITGEDDFAGDCQAVAMVGVKSRDLFQRHWSAGIHVIYFDKGYLRHIIPHHAPVRQWEYWRVAINGHNPTSALMNIRRPIDRAKKQGLKAANWRAEGDHIVFAGSSAKYHQFYGLPDPTEYAEKIIKRIRRKTDRKVIYRPKPTWKEAVPIDGSEFSGRGKSKLAMDMENAHCLVTHGSNSCFDAICAGIPCIILGDGVAKPISSVGLDDIESLKMASKGEKRQWLSNLAYCQWTMEEMASGEAWASIRPQLFR